MKNPFFWILTAVLILITGCSMGSVAMGRADSVAEKESRYYARMEEIYLDQVRDILDDAGMPRAGVMLTHIREADGTRRYTLRVHHPKLERMEKAKQETLALALTGCAFSQEGCFFESCFY